MGLFDLFSKKVTPQKMIKAAKDLENRNRTNWSGYNGIARDFPQCNDSDAKNWEIAFVINLNEEQSMQIKETEETYVQVGMVVMNVKEILFPVILFRFNSYRSLSFACITAYDMLSGNSALCGLNYFDILFSQEKINLHLMFQGERGITLFVMNRIKLSPQCSLVKDGITRIINSLPRKNGHYDTSRVEDARLTLDVMINRRMMFSDNSYGEFFWWEYETLLLTTAHQ
jgi:hypothetical protein